MRGRNDESLASLSKLRRLPKSDHRVQAEWKAIITEVKFQEEMTAIAHPGASGLKLELAEWFDLFKPKYIRRTAVALAIPFFQQVRLDVPPCVYHADP
jgi:hypothetical protein